MPWLVAADRVVASLEVADNSRARRRGLLGRDGIDGALLMRPARSVHTMGMRFAIDVAHVDADQSVISVVTMEPNRIGRYRFRARSVIEAEAGMLRRWGLKPGVTVEIRVGEEPDS